MHYPDTAQPDEDELMARQTASVHVDIARLAYEYSKISAESAEKLVFARAKWIDDLVACLALRDPKLHTYGSFLLLEVDEFKKAESERKRGNKGEIIPGNPGNSALSAESGTKVHRSDRSDQTDQDDPLEFTRQVIDYLNAKAGKSFRPGAAARKLIGARINEGYGLPDFQRVIDNKVADWGGQAKWEKFLRPATLFQASKFDSYLNEKGGPRPPDDRSGRDGQTPGQSTPYVPLL